MRTVTVPARRAFTWRGRSYVKGELVTVPPEEAAVLGRRQDVSLTVQPRGTYRTQDLVAERPAARPAPAARPGRTPRATTRTTTAPRPSRRRTASTAAADAVPAAATESSSTPIDQE